MTLNHAEMNRAIDIKERMKVIHNEVSFLLDEGIEVPLLLVLEARMLAREINEIHLFAKGRMYHEQGDEARANHCYERAIQKQAAKKEIRGIIMFLLDEMTNVSLPPNYTDEDDEYFL